VYQPQVSIVYHDHFAIFTWFSTYIIVHRLKRSNFRKRVFQLKIQIFVLMKNSAKQLVLVAQNNLKLGNSQGKTLEGYIITYIGVGVGGVP
jgi:hypothetical protein